MGGGLERNQTNKEVKRRVGASQGGACALYTFCSLMFMNLAEVRWERTKEKHRHEMQVACLRLFFLFFFLVPLDFIFFEGSRLFNDDPWHAAAPGTSPSVEGAR